MMINFKQRSRQKEWMDLGTYTISQYRHCLQQLEKVGQLLGGDRASINALRSMQPAPRSILDVGCGGGFFTRTLARMWPEAKVMGIDISKDAIDYALSKQSDDPLSNLSFERIEENILGFGPKSFDVVMATLVCHHMDDSEIISFLRQAQVVAKRAIVINDLHRHVLAFLGFGLISFPLFRNRLIVHDGLVSVLRSFSKIDWINYLSSAGISHERYQIVWQWAFRWVIKIDSCGR